MPRIADVRVQFIKGWFEETVPGYVPPQKKFVVLNMDADLYSSTILVLRHVRHLVQPGTFIYFDEFASFGHEERAFREFIEETGLKFRLAGGTNGLLHVLFQCIA